MNKRLLKHTRKSYVGRGEIYFWTVTINKWQRLLEGDEYKMVIIDSLQYLTDIGKVDVFAFVIMPNHLHLIWRINELNGKESPHGSFLKYTAHQFKKMLRKDPLPRLPNYKVNAIDKDYEFWQRDPLAIPLFTKKVAIQKLKYIHNNPMAGKWKLAKDRCDYKYSSARYYELNEKSFLFLKDMWNEF
ncbi:MAG TPA: hypothetical protein VMZ03_12980 [Chitinophagaceae bacterium]|nr:hypothetical protein [Chitinophagaceae bacterium]